MIEFIKLIFNNWNEISNAIFAIVASLLVLSEILAQIPSIKANSVFQLIYNALKSVKK